eukprot:superscaffoldBa00005825_g20827
MDDAERRRTRPSGAVCFGFRSLTCGTNAASEAFSQQRGAEQQGDTVNRKTKSIDSAGLKCGINRYGIYTVSSVKPISWLRLVDFVCICVGGSDVCRGVTVHVTELQRLESSSSSGSQLPAKTPPALRLPVHRSAPLRAPVCLPTLSTTISSSSPARTATFTLSLLLRSQPPALSCLSNPPPYLHSY